MGKPSKKSKSKKVKPTKQERLAKNVAANAEAQRALDEAWEMIPDDIPSLRRLLQESKDLLNEAHEERRNWEVSFYQHIDKHNQGKLTPHTRVVGTIGKDNRNLLWCMGKNSADWQQIENTIKFHEHNVAFYVQRLRFAVEDAVRAHAKNENTDG